MNLLITFLSFYVSSGVLVWAVCDLKCRKKSFIRGETNKMSDDPTHEESFPIRFLVVISPLVILACSFAFVVYGICKMVGFLFCGLFRLVGFLSRFCFCLIKNTSNEKKENLINEKEFMEITYKSRHIKELDDLRKQKFDKTPRIPRGNLEKVISDHLLIPKKYVKLAMKK